MKPIAALLALALASGAAARAADQVKHRPAPPLVKALDANGDGVIDAAEIANAPAALKTLDKNNDGKLTRDEYAPLPPARRGQAAGSTNGPAHPGRHGPVPPLVKALDANGDGVIDAGEIANASAALKTLDKNGDGELTLAEYAPHRRGPGAGPQGRPPTGGAADNEPPAPGDGPQLAADGPQPPPPDGFGPGRGFGPQGGDFPPPPPGEEQP